MSKSQKEIDRHPGLEAPKKQARAKPRKLPSPALRLVGFDSDGGVLDSPHSVLSFEQAERLRCTTDPRWSDLPEDCHLWTMLLTWAYDLDAESPAGLFGSLHGFRCFGARLAATPRGLRLVPGKMNRKEYAQLREQYLMPWAPLLRRLLVELGDRSERYRRDYAWLGSSEDGGLSQVWLPTETQVNPGLGLYS
jgi:hypothetical protein